jgi:4-carboxymuconolactone decarboxylase
MEDRMQDRLGPIPFAAMSAAQQVAAQVVIDGPRGGLYGPFVPLIRSPELMSAAQQMGEYLRYRSAIGTRLTGGDSGDGAPLEPAGGVGDPRADRARLRHRGGGVAAIAARQRPAAGVLLADEALVYDFCVQLHQQRGSMMRLTRRRWRRSASRGGRPDGHQRLHISGDGDERGADGNAGIGRRAAAQ